MQKIVSHLGAPEMICYKAKPFKGRFNPLLGVFVVSWQIRRVSCTKHGCHAAGSYPNCLHRPLSPTRSLSAALPQLPGTDMPFTGTKGRESDGTGIIPPCNAAFRFVTGDGSGHAAGQPQNSPLRIRTTSKPQITNCKEKYQKRFE